MREICMSGSMSEVWRRSQGRTSEAPPNERGGNRYVRPTATAPHLDSTIEAVFADHQADGEVFAHDLGIPIGRVDGIEFSVDVDLLQLVDQDHRRGARQRNDAYRELD